MLNKIADVNCFKLCYQWSFLLVKRIFELFYLLLPPPYTFHITLICFISKTIRLKLKSWSCSPSVHQKSYPAHVFWKYQNSVWNLTFFVIDTFEKSRKDKMFYWKHYQITCDLVHGDIFTALVSVLHRLFFYGINSTWWSHSFLICGEGCDHRHSQGAVRFPLEIRGF